MVTSEDVLKRTIRISLPDEGRPYQRSDFVDGLVEMGFKSGEIEALGTLRSNKEWDLTCNTVGNKDKLLAARVLKVGQYVGKISSVDKEEFTVRVHWAPYYVQMGAIVERLEAVGAEVLHSEFETSRGTGFLGGCRTLTRSFIVTGVDKETIPHGCQVMCKNKLIEVLCTVTGRQPMCIRCKQVGHIRARCEAQKCDKCGSFEHPTERCQLERRSYAMMAGNRMAQEPLSGRKETPRKEVTLEQGQGVKDKEESRLSLMKEKEALETFYEHGKRLAKDHVVSPGCKPGFRSDGMPEVVRVRQDGRGIELKKQFWMSEDYWGKVVIGWKGLCMRTQESRKSREKEEEVLKEKEVVHEGEEPECAEGEMEVDNSRSKEAEKAGTLEVIAEGKEGKVTVSNEEVDEVLEWYFEEGEKCLNSTSAMAWFKKEKVGFTEDGNPEVVKFRDYDQIFTVTKPRKVSVEYWGKVCLGYRSVREKRLKFPKKPWVREDSQKELTSTQVDAAEGLSFDFGGSGEEFSKDRVKSWSKEKEGTSKRRKLEREKGKEAKMEEGLDTVVEKDSGERGESSGEEKENGGEVEGIPTTNWAKEMEEISKKRKEDIERQRKKKLEGLGLDTSSEFSKSEEEDMEVNGQGKGSSREDKE